MTDARTTTVRNIVQRPGTSSPIAGLDVTIRLNVLGFIDGGSAEKANTRRVTTDATGAWSCVLEVNDDIDPAGTYYTVHEGKIATWSIIVPAAGSPVNLRDILVVDPANPSPLVAGVPLPGSGVPAGDVWTTDGLGGGDYAPPAGGGGDVQTVAGVSPDGTGNVPLTAANVGAATTGALASEASTRGSADTTLGGLITAEAATARAAESANATAITTEATSRATADGLRQLLSEKGQPSGYAGLDGGGTVPDAQLPAGLARDSEVTAAVAAEAAARTAAITAAIAALVNSAPALLDTLAEIDAALNNDPNFAATMTTALAGKQGVSAQLTALAGLVSAANKLPYFTGAGAAALADFTSFARTILDDPDAATARTTLGLGDVATHNASEFQPIDSDLTTIAALDATQSGVVASDGTGWFRKTYAQLKTALGLAKADVGLGNVDNTSDANKPVSTAQAAADALAAPKTTATIDLVDRADNTTETVPAGTTTNCSTAGVTKTAPALAGSVGTPPLRWAVKNLAAASITVSYPDQAGAAQSLTVLSGETRTFRQKSTLGWGVESGAVALATLDARYAVLASPAFTGSPTAPTQTAGDNSTKLATTAYANTASRSLKVFTLDPAACTSSSLTVPTSGNHGSLARIVSPGSASVSSIQIHVQTQSGNIAIGVWRDNGSDAPGTLVATTGSIACPSGLSTISLGSTITLGQGDWVGLIADNVTAKFAGTNGGGQNLQTWRAVSIAVAPGSLASNPAVTADSRVFMMVGV